MRGVLDSSAFEHRWRVRWLHSHTCMYGRYYVFRIFPHRSSEPSLERKTRSTLGEKQLRGRLTFGSLFIDLLASDVAKQESSLRWSHPRLLGRLSCFSCFSCNSSNSFGSCRSAAQSGPALRCS